MLDEYTQDPRFRQYNPRVHHLRVITIYYSLPSRLLFSPDLSLDEQIHVLAYHQVRQRSVRAPDGHEQTAKGEVGRPAGERKRITVLAMNNGRGREGGVAYVWLSPFLDSSNL